MTIDNITQVIYLLISQLRIPVTFESVENEIDKHPERHSILAVSDVLNNWRIPNAAYHLTVEELINAKIEVPFIAFLSKRGDEFVLVTQMNDLKVTVSNHNWNKHQFSIEEFKKMYAGSVLIAEKEEDSGEPDYAIKQRKEKLNNLRIPFIIGLSIAILVTFILLHPSYISTFNWQTAFLTLFKTAGLIVSILLLVQSIDTNNPLIQKLCGGENNKNCNAILSSKAAKITDELSWSEVGFFYFSGTWLILLFSSNKIQVIHVLAFLNLVSLPYTIYSIYYQWQVAKQWCIFCCIIQVLLWLEFFSFLPYLTSTTQLPNLSGWSDLFIGIALPVLVWVFVKPYFLQTKQIQPLKQQLRQFKYNTDLFNKLLNENIKYAVPAKEHSIILGNREAAHIITIVSNPYCQPCANAHKALDEWLANRDDIKLQIIFSTSDNISDPKITVAEHLMLLQAKENEASLKCALNDWYEQKQKDYNAWARKHSVVQNVSIKEALTVQREWCKATEVKNTPTIFINGHKLPINYKIEDIKYFI